MWQKLKNFEKVQISALAALLMMKSATIENYMLSWVTDDGIIHLCSFESLNSDMDVNDKTLFTVWEKRKETNNA